MRGPLESKLKQLFPGSCSYFVKLKSNILLFFSKPWLIFKQFLNKNVSNKQFSNKNYSNKQFSNKNVSNKQFSNKKFSPDFVFPYVPSELTWVLKIGDLWSKKVRLSTRKVKSLQTKTENKNKNVIIVIIVIVIIVDIIIIHAAILSLSLSEQLKSSLQPIVYFPWHLFCLHLLWHRNDL